MPRFLLAAAVFASLLSGAPFALADVVRIDTQAFDQGGNPSLYAQFFSDYGGTGEVPTWSVCVPDGSPCQPAANANAFTPGPEPAGTVFQASVTSGGQTYSARTLTWGGAVTATGQPSLRGTLAVGDHVTPVAAGWTGGYSTDGDLLGLEACRDPQDASTCLTLTRGGSCYNSESGAMLAGWLSGWYLIATDERSWSPRVQTTELCTGPYALPTLKAGATTALSQPAGPISGPPPPTGSVLATARRDGSQISVAHIHCPATCTVAVYLPSNFILPVTSTARGDQDVNVPASRLPRSGPAQISISLDGGPELHGTTVIPPALTPASARPSVRVRCQLKTTRSARATSHRRVCATSVHAAGYVTVTVTVCRDHVRYAAGSARLHSGRAHLALRNLRPIAHGRYLITAVLSSSHHRTALRGEQML